MLNQSESKQENQTFVPEEQKQTSPSTKIIQKQSFMENIDGLPEQVVTQDKVYSGVGKSAFPQINKI